MSKSEKECKYCGCDRGQAWPRVIITEHEVGFFFIPWGEIDVAISSGCRACALIKEGSEKFLSLDQGLGQVGSIWIRYRAVDERWLVSIDKVNGQKLVLEFLDRSDGGRKPCQVVESAVPWAQRQLRNCISSHERCNQSSGSVCDKQNSANVSTLPTRVLALSCDNSALKLFDPPRGTMGPYICLSYFWGRSQPMKTIQANIDCLRAHISWDSLPKTFQDAISFTRSLGIPYLWIDSLCIVQDDEDDWNKESAEMASVYQNSVLTLAATASADSNGGLFYHYTRPQPMVLSGFDNQGTLWEVHAQLRLPHWSDKNCGMLHSHITRDYPLLKRAWAYQERLLSPRTLHFCRTELVWQCFEESTCQCGGFSPSGDSKAAYVASSQMATTHVAIPKEATDPKYNKANIDKTWNSWREIVTEYSLHSLTYSTDRLPALAGLADQVHGARTSRYCAGLWEDSFLGDLLWTPSRLGISQTIWPLTSAPS